jgi:hypothetical protein
VNLKKIGALATVLVFVFAFVTTLSPVTESVSFTQDASASNLGDNITDSLETWLPLLITIIFVVAMLGLLGIKKLMG